MRATFQSAVVCLLVIFGAYKANAQNCSDVQTISCGGNANPDPIPADIAGGPIDVGKCRSTSIEALASLHAYDASCTSNSNDALKYEADAVTYLPHYTGLDAEDADFHGAGHVEYACL